MRRGQVGTRLVSIAAGLGPLVLLAPPVRPPSDWAVSEAVRVGRGWKCIWRCRMAKYDHDREMAVMAERRRVQTYMFRLRHHAGW